MTEVTAPLHQYSESVSVAAPPRVVWRLVMAMETEQWELRNLSPQMIERGEEVAYRVANARESLHATLVAMKAAAEAAASGGAGVS